MEPPLTSRTHVDELKERVKISGSIRRQIKCAMKGGMNGVEVDYPACGVDAIIDLLDIEECLSFRTIFDSHGIPRWLCIEWAVPTPPTWFTFALMYLLLATIIGTMVANHWSF